MPDPRSLLESATTIAVVGCSPSPSRDSHRVAQYLQKAGYRIIPVNPNIDSVLGEHSYPDLMSVPADVDIDIINIFRRPSATADMVRDAVKRAAMQERAPVIWPQLGVHTPEAEAIAREAGLEYVRGQCIRVVHQLQVS